jgi:hypothetical protein
MKKIPSFWILLSITACCCFACKTTTYTSENLPEKQLYFGSGGGFSGLVNEYLLLENGQMFKVPSPGNYEDMDKVKRKKAEAIYEQYATLGFNDLIFNQPGNVYYFIRMVDGELENYISWSDQRSLPEVKMMEFYASLMETIPKAK